MSMTFVKAALLLYQTVSLYFDKIFIKSFTSFLYSITDVMIVYMSQQSSFSPSSLKLLWLVRVAGKDSH